MNRLHLYPLLVNQKQLYFFSKNVCTVVHMNIHLLYKVETATHSKESFDRRCKNGNTQIHH